MKRYSLFTIFLLKSTLTFCQNVNIYRLNQCDEEDLESVKEIISEHYGYNCKIQPGRFLSKNREFVDSDSMNQVVFGSRYFKMINNLPYSIFVSNSKIKSKGQNVCGVSFGNSIYISSKVKNRLKVILIHEISHSQGLTHCENVCIMNTEYNPKFISKVWNEYSDKPIFCYECKKQLKSFLE
jgi:hypothetical protein